MRQAGFERVVCRDVMAHVVPSSRRMHRAALLLLPFARLLRRLGLCTPMQLAACEAARAQYAARRRGIGTYMIFSARKASRRCTTVTFEAIFERYRASSTAVLPPPITATGWLRKKKPSQVAQAEMPLPLKASSDGRPRYFAEAPVPDGTSVE